MQEVAESMWVSTGARSKLVEIPSTVGYHTADPVGGLDFDVGVLPLRASELEPFAGCVPLGAQDVDENDQPNHLDFGSNSYFVFGYSASRSQITIRHKERHIQQQTFQLTALPEAPATYAREQLDPAVHLALEYDHEKISSGGVDVNPPKLDGMSGGGIFHLEGREARGKLVAIATEHRRKARVLVGTRIEHFFNTARHLVRTAG